MRRVTQFIFQLFISLILTCAPGGLVQAGNNTAVLSFDGPRTATLGATIIIHATLTTPTPINVVQSAVLFDDKMVTVESISNGSSILQYWQQQPNTNAATSAIGFTGGLPTPGFQGTAGKLISFTLKAKAVGVTTLSFAPATQVLANDGNGSPLPTQLGSLTLRIEQPSSTRTTPTPEPAADTTPPTNLELIIGHDSHLFNGDWFAVFQATDADSGIAYYEIAETKPDATLPENTDWQKASSPFRLRLQTENSKVFLRAADKAGNQTIVSQIHQIKPITTTQQPYPWSWLPLLILLIILILTAILLRRNRTTEAKSVQN